MIGAYLYLRKPKYDGHSRSTGAMYRAAVREQRALDANRRFSLWLFLAIAFAVAVLVLIFAVPARANSEGAVTPGTLAPQSTLMGCVFNATPPTATNGQQAAQQCDANGRQVMVPVSPSGTITSSSGNQANANAVATLPAAAGKTTYLCGVTFTSSGSTAGAVVAPTITGTISGTMTYTYTTVTGAVLANAPLQMTFFPCVPANAVNTAIVATLPALGAGNTNATAVAWGYQQ